MAPEYGAATCGFFPVDEESLKYMKLTGMKTGDIAIAAITSCTNTSNPYVMLGAGLVAKKL